MDDIDDCIRLAQQCKLEYLKCQLQMRLNSIEMFGMSMKACSIEAGEGIELGTPSLSTLGLYELVRAITSSKTLIKYTEMLVIVSFRSRFVCSVPLFCYCAYVQCI